MDVSGQSDPDLPGDWTFVPSEDEMMDVTDAAASAERNRVEDLPLNENASNVSREKAMDKGHESGAAGGDGEGEASAGSRDSDIDIIDEDTDHSLESLSSSAIGNTSASLMGFSEISGGTVSSYGNIEVPSAFDCMDATSVASDASLPSSLEMLSGVRRYKHVPNTRLNWALTALAALVAVAAVGFGVGHYLGGSDQSLQQREMSQGQVQQLKALQDELMNCMRQQSKEAPPKDAPFFNPKVCYQDGEYWKKKFEQLFSENRGLKELLEHSQRNAVMHDPRVDSSTDCAADSPHDVHKLKLDLILNQMQHLQLMKTFNQVKHSERLSREQARKLELENEQLKARLEEEADEVLVQQQLEEKVQSLAEENQELQSRLGHESQREAALRSLEHQVQQLLSENEMLKRSMEEQVPVTTSRISLLRDTVNRLIIENEDLKAVVARLRYGPPLRVSDDTASENSKGDSQSEDTAVEEAGDAGQQPVAKDELSDLLDVLKKQHADSKQWRRLYDELKRSQGSASSRTVWRKLLTLGQTLFDDMQTGLDRTLDSLVALAKKGSSVASDVKPMVQNLGKKVRRELNRRRADLDGYLHGSGKPVESISQTMSLLESSVKKVFEAGRKFISKGQEATGKHAEKLVTKLSKVAEMLSSDWEAPPEEEVYESSSVPTSTESKPRKDEAKVVRRNGKAGSGSEQTGNNCLLGNGECTKRNGKGKEINQKTAENNQLKGKAASERPAARNKRLLDVELEEEDWFSSRAKDREQQRTETSLRDDNWYLKRQKAGWRKGSREGTYKGSSDRYKDRAEKKVKDSHFWVHESLFHEEEGLPE
uniref:Putative myosin-2 heavy chain non muscle n=1 Tax=Amblyomma aureolatum TaxID=187763 RepID=A0A1E1XAX4_9ACAR